MNTEEASTRCDERLRCSQAHSRENPARLPDRLTVKRCCFFVKAILHELFGGLCVLRFPRIP